ncbi:hypothetical protein K443DRAFT_15348 [Laccaria amethystina LaAM-08-1]|uniref:Uncharacterized protein n=1 Tax=Laccaria amethystina LaAM-08-1 TaxID=1095629 RepID=A0A0C9X158_9AGAR|nr:hypothetical protein K443DRAFT_15348 [Laccaria amethystina LaAM-08-1]
MSFRERVARREAAVIDDDKNVALHVQNGAETIQLPREQGYQNLDSHTKPAPKISGVFLWRWFAFKCSS